MDMNSITIALAVLSAFLLVQVKAQEDEETVTITNFEGFGDLTNVISTDKTKANLSCETGDMIVKLQFSQPFRGVIYADRDRNSACKTYGDGSTFYVFSIPLQGCGTKERLTSDYRMFVNDIIVRFHPALELEGDEVKTILCRYPPPVAPLPPVVVPPPLPAELPAVVEAGPRRLSEVELMLIICAILFLGLLLLGVGLAYYCLKKRNIKIVKRRTLSSGPPSQITKLSGSTLGPLSIPFDGIRIPRATAHSTSGSEAALLTSAGEHSDTITSDYPSESPSSMHSDVEEVESRSVKMSSSQMMQRSFENQAFSLHEEQMQSSSYTTRRREQEQLVAGVSTANKAVTDYQEQENMRQQEEFRRVHAMVTQTDGMPPAPKYAAEPPVYARIRKRQMEQHARDESRTVIESTEEYTHQYPPPQPLQPVVGSIPDNNLQSISEFSEAAATRSYAAQMKRHPPRIQEATQIHETKAMSDYAQEMHMNYPQKYVPEYRHEARSARSISEIEQPPPVMAAHEGAVSTKASTSRHLIDDKYITTLMETQTSEDLTHTTRDITETHIKEVPPPTWDVTIRTYPPLQSDNTADESSEVETWEKYSVVSDRPRMLFESAEDTLTTMEVQATEPPQPPPNWDVLIRVLAPPPQGDNDDLRSLLSEDDRDKWKAILTTDSTLRTLLTEAKTSEEYENIRRDERYERLFDSPKWDVIIRILAIPPDTHYDSPDTSSVGDTASYTSERPAVRYRRKSDFDARSRRSSLPPLYENGSPDPMSGLSYRSHRSSHSSVDNRSLVTDDEMQYGRYERESLYSEDSNVLRGATSSDADDPPPHHRRYHRPSLMRSTSEVLHGLETIEKDSLDGRSDDGEFGIPRRPDGTVLFERYPTTSPEQSPPASPPTDIRTGHHRNLERSATGVTVRSQTLSSSHTDREEIHSLAETDISDHWMRSGF